MVGTGQVAKAVAISEGRRQLDTRPVRTPEVCREGWTLDRDRLGEESDQGPRSLWVGRKPGHAGWFGNSRFNT